MGLCPASYHIFSSKITLLTNFKHPVQNTRIKPFIQLTSEIKHEINYMYSNMTHKKRN